MNLNDPSLQPLLDDLIQKHKLKAFIETGTGYGVSLEWAYGLGFACWSCDVETHQAVAAAKRFPHARIWQGESEFFLKMACQEAKEPALIWLDAHDAAPEHGVGPPWPLKEELGVIEYIRDGKDVILLDDITDPRFAFETYAEIMGKTHVATLLPDLGIMTLVPKGPKESVAETRAKFGFKPRSPEEQEASLREAALP